MNSINCKAHLQLFNKRLKIEDLVSHQLKKQQRTSERALGRALRPGERGLVQKRAISMGKLIVLVFGAYGETSSSVNKFISSLAYDKYRASLFPDMDDGELKVKRQAFIKFWRARLSITSWRWLIKMRLHGLGLAGPAAARKRAKQRATEAHAMFQFNDELDALHMASRMSKGY